MPTNGERLLLRILTVVGAGSTAMACGAAGGSDNGGGQLPGSGGRLSGSGGQSSAGALGFAGSGNGTGGVILQTTTPPPRDGGWIEEDGGHGIFAVAGRRVACHGDYHPSRVVDGQDPLATVAGVCSVGSDEHLTSVYVCFDAPEGGSCNDTYDPNCVARSYQCGLGFLAKYVCGPVVEPDTSRCCYAMFGSCAVGRPLIVGSSARLAPLGEGGEWTGRVAPDVTELDAAARCALADAYAADGLSEHASVASFARFVLHCLALGAPADIVEGAQRAMADEIAHARLSFGLASAYGGRDVAPGALDVSGALDEVVDLAQVAARVVREGCIAETISALLIAAAADVAADPAVRAVLARVAKEENEHALLAWRFVRWALQRGDDGVRRALEWAFAHAEQYVGFGARTELPGSLTAMRAHGYLPIEERRIIATDALHRVVMPAARALLGVTRPDSSSTTP